jgi:hypothetical protein
VNYNNLKTINLLIVMLFFFSFKGTCQNVDDMKTLLASGNSASGTSGSVTYSIGQVFYTYIGESVYNVAQGIQHQETEKILETSEESKTELIVFPNPTSDYVNLRLQGSELEYGKRYYELYDIQGRLLKQNTVTESESQISLSNLKPALYILTVYIDNQVLKTFKILKK